MITTAEKETRITHSQMQTAKTCLRKEFLAYQLGIRPERSAKPLRIGSAIHWGLDQYKKCMLGNAPVPGGEACYGILCAVQNKYNETRPVNDEYVYDWEIERATVIALLSGYFWRWAEMDADIKYIASEQKFDVPIINPESGRSSRLSTVAGMIDGIVELPGKQIAVMEHKTTSDDLSPDSDYWKRLRIDSQISLYYLAVHQLGFVVETVYYDVIKKPTIKPKNISVLDADGIKQVIDRTTGERLKNKNSTWKQSVSDKETQALLTRPETPDEFQDRLLSDITTRPDFYYARREIPRLDADIEEFQYELWQMTKLLHECQRFNRYPRNTGACVGFGTCAYFDLCTSGYEIGSGIIPDGYVVVDNVHQELEED